MQRVAALLLLLAACSGRVASSEDPPTCLDMACAAWSDAGGGRGQFRCEDGAIIVACCGLSLTDLDRLAAGGDVFAKACLEAGTVQ